MDTPESFFHQLFGSRSHVEVNVSRAFAMCFRESPPFARAVLELLHRVCRLRQSSKPASWHCRTEVSFSKGRPDIEIHAPGHPLFRLESKVGAPLTKNQLRRYRFKERGRYLVAVTKRPPDVGNLWVASQGAFAVRWQDVHRAVSCARTRGRDRYLRDSFCLYLEELGMAHREDVRVRDLERLNELFNAIAGDRRWVSVSPRNAFDVADSCLHLLREVARDAREEVPSLTNWARTGPFYSKNNIDGRHYHHLGFWFHRQGGREKIGAGFTFRQDMAWSRWEVWRFQKNQQVDDSRYEPIARVCRRGALDRGKMLRAFVKGARTLGMRMPRK